MNNNFTFEQRFIIWKVFAVVVVVVLQYFFSSFETLEQGLANYNLWTKFAQPPAFINSYWDTAMFILLHIVYGCFCAIKAELSSYSRDCIACKNWIIFIWPFKAESCPAARSWYPLAGEWSHWVWLLHPSGMLPLLLSPSWNFY